MLALSPARLVAATFAALVAGVALGGPADAARKPARDTLLISELRPFPGHTERGIVHLTARREYSSVFAVWMTVGFQERYQLALSRRSCRFLEGNPDQPIIVGGFGDFTGDASRTETVDRDETITIGANRTEAARSMVVYVGGSDRVRACGAVRRASVRPRTDWRPIGSDTELQPVGGSGVSGRVLTEERRRRLAIQGGLTCQLEQTCQRLMEEEGIFYFVRAPCGTAFYGTGVYRLTLGPTVARLAGNAINLHARLTTSVRRMASAITLGTRSVRVVLGGEELACGNTVALLADGSVRH